MPVTAEILRRLLNCGRNRIVSSALDYEAVVERWGGDRELVRELAQLFIQDCPGSLGEVRRAIAAKNAARLLECAHALKGSVANFSTSAAAAAHRLERMGEEGKLEGASEVFEELEQEIAELLPALQAIVAESVPG